MTQAADPPQTIFLLSPANCSGQRAKMLLSEQANFALARQLRETGAPLGDIFSFLSGLYFRGKLTYARAFAQPSASTSGICIITAGRGLLEPDNILSPPDIREFQTIPIDEDESRYREPLARDSLRLAKEFPAARFILLGSIATRKYTAPLQPIFGDRLLFPAAFIGRGDMSRGSLLLRAVDEGQELHYAPLTSIPLHGPRPEP